MKPLCVIGDFILDCNLFVKPRFNPEGKFPCFTTNKNNQFSVGGAGNVKECLEKLGNKVDFFYSGERSTKIRIIHKNKVIFRIDEEYEKYMNESFIKKEQELLKNIENNYSKYDYCVVSDYNKGTITKKIAKKIMEKPWMVIVDCKPNHMPWFKGCFLMKPNAREFILSGKKHYALYTVVTKGKKGIELYKNGEKVSVFKGHKVKSKDVTGAGDVVLATLVNFINKGKDINFSIEKANKAGSICVQHLGCYKVKPTELNE